MAQRLSIDDVYAEREQPRRLSVADVYGEAQATTAVGEPLEPPTMLLSPEQGYTGYAPTLGSEGTVTSLDEPEEPLSPLRKPSVVTRPELPKERPIKQEIDRRYGQLDVRETAPQVVAYEAMTPAQKQAFKRRVDEWEQQTGNLNFTLEWLRIPELLETPEQAKKRARAKLHEQVISDRIRQRLTTRAEQKIHDAIVTMGREPPKQKPAEYIAHHQRVAAELVKQGLLPEGGEQWYFAKYAPAIAEGVKTRTPVGETAAGFARGVGRLMESAGTLPQMARTLYEKTTGQPVTPQYMRGRPGRIGRALQSLAEVGAEVQASPALAPSTEAQLGRYGSPRWWVSSVSEQVPQLIAMIGGGAVGGAAGKALGFGARATRALQSTVALGGIGALEATDAYTTIRQKLLETGVPEDVAESQAATWGASVGVVNALLERLPFGEFVLRNNPAKNVLLGAVRGALVEGGTEGLQEVTAILAEMGAGAGMPTKQETIRRTVDSVLIGSVLGAGIGGGAPVRTTETTIERTVPHAPQVREDQGRVPVQAGPAAGRGEAAGRADIQRPAEARPEARQREVPEAAEEVKPPAPEIPSIPAMPPGAGMMGGEYTRRQQYERLKKLESFQDTGHTHVRIGASKYRIDTAIKRAKSAISVMELERFRAADEAEKPKPPAPAEKAEKQPAERVQPKEDMGEVIATLRERAQQPADHTVTPWKDNEAPPSVQTNRVKPIGGWARIKKVSPFGTVSYETARRAAVTGPAAGADHTRSVARSLREFLKTTPEFAIDPTFTVGKDGRLVFRDGYKFQFEPVVFGLDSEQLQPGQRVRFDLEAYGLKPARYVKAAEKFAKSQSARRAAIATRKAKWAEKPTPKPKAKPAGKAGFPKAFQGRMDVSMEPGGKPMSARKILDYAQEAFRVPLRGFPTRKPRIYRGFYYPRQKGIRMIDVRNLSTAMHEIGHYIDWTHEKRWSKRTPGPVAKELLRLGKTAYGKRKPAVGYKAEGWAEYIRLLLTTDNPATEAPAVHEWFQGTFLPGQQDIARKLARVKQMVADFRFQGAEARVEGWINRKEIKGTLPARVRRIGLWLDKKFRDELVPLRLMMQRAGIKKGELPPSQDPYQLAVAYADKAPAKARQFVLGYTTDMAGERTGPSLRAVIAPIRKDIKTFTRWIAAYRAKLLHKRGIKSGIERADADYVFEKYNSPEWRKVAKDITDWNHRLLDYLVEAGGLDKSNASHIKEMNPVYVPFIRAFAKGEVRLSSGVGRGLTRHGKAVHRIKGSGREIVDPFESMITQAQRIISIAQKSDIARALVNLEKSRPGLAAWIWRVPAPTQATQVSAEQLKKDVIRLAVERLGLKPDEINAQGLLDTWDDVLTVYSNAGHYYGKDNVLSLVVDGKRQWYEVDPAIYKLLEGMDPFSLPKWLNLTFGKTTRAVRMGATGLNPAFGLIRNFARDAGTFTVFAEHAKAGPLSALSGVAADVVRTEPAQKFKAMGGKMAGQVLHDRTATQHLRGELLASSIGDKAIHHVEHPVQALRELFGVTEAGTRIGEFAAALKKGDKRWGKGSKDSAIYALNAAQDVTVNFTRHGEIGKIINQVIPFFNAGIQGPDKLVRTFRARPVPTTLTAIAAGTIPALMLWWRNKDEEWYENLPAYEKANYLHFEVPDKDVIVRFPVPFELGHVFQTFPVVAADAYYHKDPGDARKVLGEALRSDNPADWPAAIGPIVDVLSNEDWAGRPIVPQSVARRLPKDQAKPYTTRLMKLIGKTINYSPAKLEYMSNAYSGGLYSRVSRTGELVIGPRDRELMMTDYPVIGTLFVRDAYAPKAQIERFYERRDLLGRKNQSKEISATENSERLRINRAARSLSPEWKRLRKAKTEAERRRIYKRIGGIIDRAMK